jgi:hypothetical protein
MAMTIQEVEKYFGTLYRAAKQLKIEPASVYGWKKTGKVPLLRQYEIERLTNRKLKADERDLEA